MAGIMRSTTTRKTPYVQAPGRSQKEGFRKVPVKAGLPNGSVSKILTGLNEEGQVVLQR